jgi:hypothetical protein
MLVVGGMACNVDLSKLRASVDGAIDPSAADGKDHIGPSAPVLIADADVDARFLVPDADTADHFAMDAFGDRATSVDTTAGVDSTRANDLLASTDVGDASDVQLDPDVLLSTDAGDVSDVQPIPDVLPSTDAGDVSDVQPIPDVLPSTDDDARSDAPTDLPSDTTQDVTLDPSLRASYLFDENGGTVAWDQSSYGNSGSVAGTWVTGVSGSAVRTSGVNAIVTIPNSASLAFSGKDFSLEAWVRPSPVTVGSAAWRWVITKFMTTPGGYGMYMAQSPATQLCMATYKLTPFCIDNAFADGVWAHVAAVATGPTWQLYVNGTCLGSQSGNGADLVLGTSVVALGLGASLDLDNVQIWSRARTQAEICADAGRNWLAGACQ